MATLSGSMGSPSRSFCYPISAELDCPVCGSHFDRLKVPRHRESLVTHLRVSHNVIELFWRCQICKEPYSTYRGVAVHHRTCKTQRGGEHTDGVRPRTPPVTKSGDEVRDVTEKNPESSDDRSLLSPAKDVCADVKILSPSASHACQTTRSRMG